LRGEHTEEEAEGVFLIISVRWRNTNQISRYNFIHEPDTCIITHSRYEDCTSYDVLSTSAFYDTQGKYFSKDVNLAPGESTEGWLVYDIPEDLAPAVLRIYFWDQTH